MMKRSFFPALIIFTISAVPLTAQSSHIKNPGFGPSSRFTIIKDENIKSKADIADEKDSAAQEKNPQYQKSSHHQNSSVRKITSSEIENKHPADIQDLLISEGFLVMTTGGTGAMSNLSYKGYAGFCIKVYVDGILSNNSTTGEFDWNSIDVSSIETIEIEDVPSLSETEFAGCIIRITTRNGGDKLMADVSVSGYDKSFFDTWNAKVRYDKTFSNFNFNLGADVIFAGNEFEQPAPLGTQHYNYSNQAHLNYAWNYRLSENANLYGSNSFAYNKIKANRNSDMNTGIETDVSSRNNVNFSYKTESLKSDTSFFYNFNNVNYVNNYLTDNIDNTMFNKFSLTENIKWFCDFTGGIDFEFLPSNVKAYRAVEKIGAGKKFELGEFSIEPQVVAMFWQNENPGAAVLPRLTMSWQGLTVAGYREFVLPTFNQLYCPDTSYACGNMNLKPEEGWSGFVGFRRDDFPVWAQYKISYYKDKIRWVTSGAKMIPQNNGEGFYNVVTVGTSLRVFNDILQITADGTWTSAKLCDTGKQIMWVPDWQAHASITVNYWRFMFNADYSFIGYRWDSNENTKYYPAMHLLNMSCSFDCTDNIQLYLKATNLLDQRVPYHDNYYMPSRKITIGVKLEK